MKGWVFFLGRGICIWSQNSEFPLQPNVKFSQRSWAAPAASMADKAQRGSVKVGSGSVKVGSGSLGYVKDLTYVAGN